MTANSTVDTGYACHFATVMYFYIHSCRKMPTVARLNRTLCRQIIGMNKQKHETIKENKENVKEKIDCGKLEDEQYGGERR